MDSNCTYPDKEKVVAATKLKTNYLKDWQLADKTFDYLKKQGFDCEESCLVKVIAIDSLYNTNLHYQPRLREHIASVIHSHANLFKQDNLKPECALVQKIAQISLSEKPGKNFSFASKFCHFFVCSEYPIFDSLVCDAIKCFDSNATLKPYASFYNYVIELKNKLADQEITISTLDQYFWLIGKYLQWKERRNKPKKRKNGGKKSEVFELLDSADDQQQKFLNILTANDYKNELQQNKR